MPHKTSLQALWRTKLQYAFNKVLVGRLFRLQSECIIVGCEDGIIRLYDIPTGLGVDSMLDEQQHPMICLETKGGPIQSLVVADVTRFSTADLIAGDSRGMLTIFCNGQILRRQSLSEYSLNCLQVDIDATNNLSIVAGDSSGVINALLPYSHLWKLTLNPTLHAHANVSPPCNKCLLTTTLVSSNGQMRNYVLASDNNRNLHFISQGVIVQTLQTPAVVTAMCCGNFLSKDEVQLSSEMPVAPTTTCSQVALGGQDGSIFIMSNFQIHETEYANMQLPIMHLASIATSNPSDDVDFLLSAGYSNFVKLYHCRKMINTYEASDWVSSLAVADLSKNGENEVLVGCRDGSLHALRVS